MKHQTWLEVDGETRRSLAESFTRDAARCESRLRRMIELRAPGAAQRAAAREARAAIEAAAALAAGLPRRRQR